MTTAEILRVLLGRGTLSRESMQAVFRALAHGELGTAEAAAFLALLATRSPTAEELVAAVEVMREHLEPVVGVADREHLIDTCGTGGAPKTFNVSTLAAIAGAALFVADHVESIHAGVQLAATTIDSGLAAAKLTAWAAASQR